MLRIQKISVIAAFLLLIWSFALTLPGSPAIHLIITLAPLIALVLFGIKLLLTLIIGVANFRTVPVEAELLQEDIIRARKELKKRGVALE
ncbi:hypothetical protein Ndes2526B_g00991 [Nannochloris sp. 'desiccata']|nr:hypothetical protein KSW81_002180 [Chlorella desiccata (nom. nud.)]KAH7623758.1 hypothetical protein NADE_008576 [Chlorella desiccata (nom. nud.)]